VHLNSQLLFERHALGIFQSGQRVLEIGPDTNPSTYRRLVALPEIDWTTVDLEYGADHSAVRRYAADGSAVDHLMSDRYALPFPSGTFDVVMSGQVIEHVPKIWRWFTELSRVCKPEGHVITVCPISWPYHEAPVDCWRVFPDGMRALCDDAGLDVIFSSFESLEPRPSRRTYPGPSHRWNETPTLSTRLKDRARAIAGWPTPTALDTLTIARKPDGTDTARTRDFEDRVIRPAALDAMVRRTDNFATVTWLGHPIWQNVTDAWAIQEALCNDGVDLVVECGTHRGGSAFYMASLFDLIGKGHVITIDIERIAHIEHPRVEFIVGSSIEEHTVRVVRERMEQLAPSHVLIVLDSDHSAHHVRREIETYAELLPIGDYMLVQDGCIDDLPSMTEGRPGPLAAIESFLKDNDRFVVDEERSGRYLVSHSPKGWIRRVG
jgi:cephalosporin hydroxylase/SAM-dependent methyltransferase